MSRFNRPKPRRIVQKTSHVCSVYNENPGNEFLCVADETSSDTLYFSRGVFSENAIVPGESYLFTLEEIQQKYGVKKFITSFSLAEPILASVADTCGVAMIAPCVGNALEDSTWKVLLLRTRTSPAELYMCYYWDHLANNVFLPQIRGESAPEWYVVESKRRLVSAFAEVRHSMLHWELVAYSQLHEGKYADIFKNWLLKRQKRGPQFAEAWHRAMLCDASIEVHRLADEELRSRDATLNAAAPSSECGLHAHWEIPKGSAKMGETSSVAAWRELWEEAACQPKPLYEPPSSFNEAPFKITTRRFKNALQTCMTHVYVLSSDQDFPLGHLDGNAEHQEHRWVPLGDLEQHMNAELAISLRSHVLSHVNLLCEGK